MVVRADRRLRWASRHRWNGETGPLRPPPPRSTHPQSASTSRGHPSPTHPNPGRPRRRRHPRPCHPGAGPALVRQLQRLGLSAQPADAPPGLVPLAFQAGAMTGIDPSPSPRWRPTGAALARANLTTSCPRTSAPASTRPRSSPAAPRPSCWACRTDAASETGRAPERPHPPPDARPARRRLGGCHVRATHRREGHADHDPEGPRCGPAHRLEGRPRTPIEPRNVNRSFDRRLQQAGLRRVRLHDLRESFGALLLERDEESGEPGTHVRVVMELLGHSQLSETLKRYTKVREGLKREALGRLDALLRTDVRGAGEITDDQADQLLSGTLSLAAWFGLRCGLTRNHAGGSTISVP
jgi:Phage integrase family